MELPNLDTFQCSIMFNMFNHVSNFEKFNISPFFHPCNFGVVVQIGWIKTWSIHMGVTSQPLLWKPGDSMTCQRDVNFRLAKLAKLAKITEKSWKIMKNPPVCFSSGGHRVHFAEFGDPFGAPNVQPEVILAEDPWPWPEPDEVSQSTLEVRNMMEHGYQKRTRKL